jgi:hypothetical protein
MVVILTYNDFKDVLTFFKINYRKITIDVMTNSVVIEIYKIKWYQFIIKCNLYRCKNLIEMHKPFTLKIEYIFK